MKFSADDIFITSQPLLAWKRHADGWWVSDVESALNFTDQELIEFIEVTPGEEWLLIVSGQVHGQMVDKPGEVV